MTNEEIKKKICKIIADNYLPKEMPDRLEDYKLYRCPMLKEIVHLGIKTAIAEVEKAEKKIFSRSGVWNDYSLTTKERAISAIEKCGYGADIYIDEGKNIYVSMPCQSDMW